MIIKASACSWGKGLAAHLMKEENEHVLIHELRGFVSDDLDGAFREAKAVSLKAPSARTIFSRSASTRPTAHIARPPISKRLRTGWKSASVSTISLALWSSTPRKGAPTHMRSGRGST
jgi:hypothetical protein